MECVECDDLDIVAPSSNDPEINKNTDKSSAAQNDNKRERNLTERGKLELIRRLKNQRTSALSATSKTRTKLTSQMSSEENLHLVKSYLAELDLLFNNFQEIHEELFEHLTEDERDGECDYFFSKQSAFLEFKNQVVQWIEIAEQRLTDRAESLRSGSSRESKGSRRSGRNGSLRSVTSAREKERLKLAEMIAEKSFLKRQQEIEKRKHEIDAATEEFELEVKIAKSRARERMYATMIEELETTLSTKSTPLTLAAAKERIATQTHVATTERNAEQHDNNGSKCLDAGTEGNEQRNTKERIATETRVATTERNAEQHDNNGSKCLDAGTERNEQRNTKERITTETHVAGTERNEQRNTKERITTETHVATTERNEQRNTNERIATQTRVATTERNAEQHDNNGSKCLDAGTERNEQRNTKERITTQTRVATTERNAEQHDNNGSKCLDAGTERNEQRNTKERIATQTHVATTERNAEQHDDNGSKCLDVGTERNEHSDTKKRITAETHLTNEVPDEQRDNILYRTSRPYCINDVEHNDQPNKDKEIRTNYHQERRNQETTADRLFTTPNMCSTPSPNASSFSENVFSNLLTTQLEQHREILSSHQEMAAAMRLPQPKVPLFRGDVVENKSFTMAFDSRIKSKTSSSADLLYYLHQHLSDEPRDLIEGCLHLEPEEGYTEARKLLDKEYGDPYKVSVAYTNKLQRWPPVRYEDAAALKRLSLFLTKCRNAMKNISYMDVLNHTPQMQNIVQKLPGYLQSKWRERVLKIRQQSKLCANFSDLVEFVEHAAETSNDPVYSKEALCKQDERVKSSIRPIEPPVRKPASQAKQRTTRSLATSLGSPNNSPDGAGSVKPQEKVSKCPLCDKLHDLEECKDFVKKTLEEKKKFLTEMQLCFACYGTNHRSKGCTNKRVCTKCSKPHPTTLHVDNFNIKEPGSYVKQNNKPAITNVNSTCTDIINGQPARTIVLQAILPVKVTSKDGNCVTTYALYDNGSSGSFITESLKEDLNVKGVETTLQLGTMHGQNVIRSFIVKELLVSDLEENNSIKLNRCFTRHEIPVSHEQIPTPQLIGKLDNLNSLMSKIPDLMPHVEIGLLIGSDCPLALEPLEVLPSGGKGPFAMRLRHGWTVNGPLQLDVQPGEVHYTNTITVKELESSKEIMTPHTVLKMFALDFDDHMASSDALSLSKEDEKFLKIASEGIRLKDGHYELPLPFRDPEVILPNNRNQAVKRANWQRKKMIRDERYRTDYTNFINDTIEKGYARRVPDHVNVEAGKVWYIPHHGVYHPKKPEKIRVVFDCSAKYHGISLNDTLLQGPNLTSSLVGVLTRFRQEPVAFMADIEQMFYQVQVPECQRNFLRFLWWPDGDLNADLKEFQMNVHLFGAISSPSCANFALRHVCDDNETEFDPEVTSTVRNNFYVDDCLRSAKDKTSAIELVKNVKCACTKGGFNLTKFVCNDREVLESIPKEQRSKEVKTLDLQHDDLPMERALGVQWCVESDQLKFRITVSEKPLTRRGILSTVSSIYDPLGIVAPFTFTAKKLLQDLCREKAIGWDTEIPQRYLVQWEQWRKQLPMLEMLALDRCLIPQVFGKVVFRQVHVFSDASSTGYGAVAYLRQCDDKEQIHCSFLMGKARLAPVKTTTIPRLELTAATVSARVGQMLKTELDGDVSLKYHTDSTTVLRYLANQRTRFKVFVANRVQTILNLSDTSQWRYVSTKENPADDASRGLNAQSLLHNQRWLNGPAFLWEPEDKWPEQPFALDEIRDDDPEVKIAVTSNATMVTQESTKIVDKLIQHYSDWYRLKKAVAVYLRVRKVLQSRRERRLKSNKETKAGSKPITAEQQPLSVQEIQEAERAILQYVQFQTYQYEIRLISKTNSNGPETKQSDRASKREMKKTSSIYHLDPYLDQGILRVGGRLGKAELSEETIHPAILPRHSHVTMLIINDAHKTVGHAGRGHVLAKLRERYWIVSANAAVRHAIARCVTCRRNRGKPSGQKMADLPKDRVSPAPPFTFTGVDYFGPYIVKDGRKEVKRYGALFTCLASRAVHIEIANSLETDSFIQALRRFIARRGTVKMIRSDNGTNFVGAQAELREAIKEMNNDHIADKLRKSEIEWVFNPPAASNFGGVWERQIRTTRKVLSGLLSEYGCRLDDESLRTLMCEVEAVINSRPLTFVSGDADDLEPLTPSHLLTTKPTVVLPPPGNFQREDVYIRRRWRRIQYLTNLFWSRWKAEYLTTEVATT